MNHMCTHVSRCLALRTESLFSWTSQDSWHLLASLILTAYALTVTPQAFCLCQSDPVGFGGIDLLDLHVNLVLCIASSLLPVTPCAVSGGPNTNNRRRIICCGLAAEDLTLH